MYQAKEGLIADLDCGLTIGTLKKLLDRVGLPDDTPVYYQRIGDVFFKKHGWSIVRMPWDFERLQDDRQVEGSRDMRVIERSGARYLALLDDFIPAWSAHVAEDRIGSKALVICAHY